MGLLFWAIFGLIAGAIAKWIMPGPDGDSWFKTMLLGVGGAWVGGFVGTRLGVGSVTGFNVGSMATAVAGALIILWISRKMSK